MITKVISKCRICGKEETIYVDDDVKVGFVEHICLECFKNYYYSEEYWTWTE